MKDVEHAFYEMKRLIMKLPSLTTLVPKETLYVYLATSQDAVSGVLLAEHKGKQIPIQYAHPIKVITDQPIKHILNTPEVFRKLAKYAVEVKENQEKDKIRSKPDKNGKRGEAGKSLKQWQSKEEEKPKKTKKEWPKTHTRIKMRCLEEGIWAKDEKEARNLRIKISQYIMKKGVLFKNSYLAPMLRCVGPLKVNYVIREVHEEAYGMHFGPRLERERVGWVDELPNVLCVHRIMLKTWNDETPFSLTYGSEAVILTKISMPTFWTIQFNEARNEEEM
nr:reverse transcriptase domain-containing protein [Tanacetum cinerariifolium]